MPPTDDQIRRIKEQRARQKFSVVFDMPDLAEPGKLVSEAEVEFFKENGFLVKTNMLDPDKLTLAFDRVWEHLVAAVPVREGCAISRDDVASWVNPQWETMPPHPADGPYLGRQPIEYFGRTVKMHDIGGAQYLMDLLPNDPGVVGVARALLGEDLRKSLVTRGVYAIFPTTNDADPTGQNRLRGGSLGPHLDQVCQQLNVCAYLDDVTPRNGGFTVYPGSHRMTFETHEYEANWSPRESFAGVLRDIVENVEPYELVAEKGSVIFWHGRMVHSPGVHIGRDIRWALITDFTENLEILNDAEHKEVGQYEWFKNAKLFREDRPVTDDMWRHWRLQAST